MLFTVKTTDGLRFERIEADTKEKAAEKFRKSFANEIESVEEYRYVLLQQ